MDWFVWAYGVAALVTTGAAYGASARDGDASLLGSLIVGALWPIMWVAAITYAVMNK